MAVESVYYSHRHVLKGLARLLTIKRVLEFGSGHFSTGLFLDRTAFPDLELLCTAETDWNWYQQIREEYSKDPRLWTVYYGGEMADLVHMIWKGTTVEVPTPNYDLIFIDDSETDEERAQTIRTVVSYLGLDTVLVVHDFQVAAYKEATKGIPNRYEMRAFFPTTGVLWNRASLTVGQLVALDLKNSILRREES